MPNLTSSPLFFFFLQIVSFSILRIHAGKDDYHCPTTRCSDYGPEIRFPFRLEHKSAPNCGYPHPAFQLSCDGGSENITTTTLIHIWPSSPALVVERIIYKEAKIQLFIPDGCFEALLFNRSLSHSPFRFFRSTNATVINCSMNKFDNIDPKDLCSTFGSTYLREFSDNYFVDDMPLSCHSVKTIEIDIGDDWIFGASRARANLRWELPLCGHCDGSGRSCYTKNMTTRTMGCHPGINRKLIITGVTLGLFVVVIGIFIIGVKAYQSLKCSKLDREYQLKVEKFLEDYESLKPTRYTFHEIKRMTNSFRTKLGEGGYGSVFKGELPNGVLVAVKLLNGFNSFADGDEFINEVGTIGRIHHVNVVRLLGFCAENLKRALVYEFMSNESLEKFIIIRRDPASSTDYNNIQRSGAGPLFLGWKKLEEIAIGIARGIKYLHQGCDHRILHFDIKPHNILVDDNFVPKVSDFGLAKLCSKGQSIVSVTAARGTMGYIAPEVFSRNFGNVSHKSDVYSFGMLLLEMVGGRKRVDETVEVEAEVNQVYFPEWIYKQYLEEEEEGVEELEGTVTLSDDQAGDDDEGVMNNIARKLSIVGLWCIQWYPVDRPSMHGVVQMLEGSGEGLTVPPSPFNSSANSNPQESAPRRPHFSHLSVINE
ncbi:hypothetical protein H6P81_013361 [Aristolochia fimbriata]|uniref:Protein kinase domain-containing protein n=1 Tax=Aristolochia fimbriata TaxID=158543 RepID=A0AAV7EEH2_ARIFI|nr:hypothetical protein H6P81_013361 [Aristolochia fimbriata]